MLNCTKPFRVEDESGAMLTETPHWLSFSNVLQLLRQRQWYCHGLLLNIMHNESHTSCVVDLVGRYFRSICYEIQT